MGSAPLQVVEFEEAVRIVLEHASAFDRGNRGSHQVPLLESLGRVLAVPIAADRDQPGFDRSTRDGFALRTEDWKTGARLRVAGQVRAGESWQGGELQPGTVVEIMTGAPVPRGADAVVMVEHVRRQAGMIAAADGRRLSPGENIVLRGSEAKLGERVLTAGTRMGAAEIALAATCGCAQLSVFSRPTVAIVSTGDELVEVDQEPAFQQIRNSNSYALAAMVTAAGGSPRRLQIARDLREEVRARLVEALHSDLIVLSGGVSMGEYDLVEEVLTELGAEFFFTGVKMQPGKPVVFGRLPSAKHATYFFGLPGNPISTQVTFHCFAELFLRVIGGETVAGPRWAQATLAADVPAKPGLTRLLPARMDGIEVTLTGWQGSGDLAANARANCYAELKPGQAYAAGDVLRVLLR
jgi:molybdopterin molybdotransferase